MKDSDQQAVDLLKLSLAEAQTATRAYDTKAQIVGVGYIFSLGIVGEISDRIPGTGADIGAIAVTIGWMLTIVPIVLFGAVLYPTRKTYHDQSRTSDGEHRRERVLFVDSSMQGDVEALKAAARRADPLDEVAHELMKMSTLRDIKRTRFLRGLFCTGLSFVVMFAFQATRGFLA